MWCSAWRPTSKGAARQHSIVNVAEPELDEMGDLAITGPLFGLRMAGRRGVHAKDTAPELSCQVARRSPAPAADVPHHRFRRTGWP